MIYQGAPEGQAQVVGGGPTQCGGELRITDRGGRVAELDLDDLG
jgi:hypothetical protein